jgi:tetratricopeptide (TPR) repeat protein
LRSPSPDHPGLQPLAGQLVVFTGKLSSLGRRDARALVARLGGASADEVNSKTTMLVVGSEVAGPDLSGGGHDDGQHTPEWQRDREACPGVEAAGGVSTLAAGTGEATESRGKSNKLRRAEELNAERPGSIEIISENEFCRLAGIPTPESLKRQYFALRDLMARYRSLREDHVRYLIKCGIVGPALRTNADVFFEFGAVAVIKQANDQLAQGLSFRRIVRSLLAEGQGQLAFDFRLDAAPARVFTLRRQQSPEQAPQARSAGSLPDRWRAEEYFRAGSALDDGDQAKVAAAAAAYRKALELDPHLAAALINLANIHYGRDELVEAQALYERAIVLEPDFFEAHFNLGNIYHDLGRYAEAQACYLEALRLNPFYADTHFYLAVTLEKRGQSQQARPHWRAYQQLAPQGEWVELAREFSE